MEVVYKNCCGLDVHKKSIVACIMTGRKKEIRTFGTMTEELLELVDWIKETKCECVAMESTGVYWKPIYNLLELEEIKSLVVNAHHIKNVPGRKTDVKDAEWIAKLLKHGLINGSFIPSREQRELRELLRYRRSLIRERTAEVARLQKVLEGANIKLASVASNVLGVSGRAMLEGIINGIESTEQLALLAKGTLRKKIPELQKALNGLVKEHQKMILASQLKHIDFLNEHIDTINEEIDKRLKDKNEYIEILDSIPGIGKRAAEVILAEIGVDMDKFSSAAKISSWAGLTPGCFESAGKRKSAKTRKGNEHLRSTLVEAARSLQNSKDSYLSAQYRRIKARRGANRAAVAVAHSLLVIIYHVIKNKKPYEELGADYLDKIKETNKVDRAKKLLENLGYDITKVA